jgi:hypothetical protein
MSLMNEEVEECLFQTVHVELLFISLPFIVGLTFCSSFNLFCLLQTICVRN